MARARGPVGAGYPGCTGSASRLVSGAKGASRRVTISVLNTLVTHRRPVAMIRDRYDPMQLFELVPQLQLRFEPELAELDRLLDDDRLFQQVKADLARRWPKSPVTGRPGTPVEVVLRLLVIKHLYGWSYEQTEQFVGDSLVLRQCCRLYLATTPADTTLLRWANLIQPETLHHLLARVTELAAAQRVTRGRKLRTDSTVVETNIPHPSDSTLLADGVRVLSRLVRRAQSLPGAVGPPGGGAGGGGRRSGGAGGGGVRWGGAW